jgi:HD-GYP domain-containing protein (c-di-GMP phosphodiesterase class II)
MLSKILGPSGRTGPHTVEPLIADIQHSLDTGSTEQQTTDRLFDYINRIDYPDQSVDTRMLVPDLAAKMADALSIAETKKLYLVVAAKIYDIGKIAIDHEILSAERSLDKEELFEIQQHVNIAVQNILKSFKIFHPVLSIIKFHHERWDGSGYPWQLKNEEISVESQIIGLLDSLKAMISDRPYRPRMPLQQALNEIIQNKDRLFNPELVDVLLKILKQSTLS